jgi:hypothetical protein
MAGVGVETSVGSVGIISLSQGVIETVIVREDASEASKANVYDADIKWRYTSMSWLGWVVSKRRTVVCAEIWNYRDQRCVPMTTTSALLYQI